MKAIVGAEPHHYRLLGLQNDEVEPWEDGLRTNAAEGSFEWWYLDCHLEDGSSLIITFYTKPPQASVKQPLSPMVTMQLTRPDGSRVDQVAMATASEFHASRERCDVRIGENTFKGDLQTYQVNVKLEDVQASVTLHREVPSWREATGHVFFGAQEEHHVAWLPAVPQGRVEVELKVDGERRTLQGTGYHDHNWGNVTLRKVIDHWYWARARVGLYTAIGLNFVVKPAYGGSTIPAFLLAHNGKIIAADRTKLRFSSSDVCPNDLAVPVANLVEFDYSDDKARYRVSFQRKADILQLPFGNVGAYVRFSGQAVLEIEEKGRKPEKRGSLATWELLHFGPEDKKSWTPVAASDAMS
jgi:hypothetical protein